MSAEEITVGHVIDVVIRLLSEERGESEVDTRAWLEEAGRELPIDSLLIVEILTKVEQECGVTIPADVEAARSMRSVVSFAETVVAASRTTDKGGEGGGGL
jgi:acyl carrier protein